MYMQRYPILLLASLLIWPLWLPAQALVGERRVKEFETDESWPYPYESVTDQAIPLAIAFKPVVQLDGGSFVQVWKSRKGGFRDRMLTAYNLFLEQSWETEVKLDREEDIIYLMHADTLVYLVSRAYDYGKKIHQARARAFGVESGVLQQDTIIWTIFGERDIDMMAVSSPDGEQVLLFHLYQDEPMRQVGITYGEVGWDDRAGFKARQAAHLNYLLLDRRLGTRAVGQFDLPVRKRLVVDCRPDDAGNVYVVQHERPRQLHVYQRRPGDTTQYHLAYDSFVKLEYLSDHQHAHLPALAASGQRLFVSMGVVQRRGRMRGTKAFRLIGFDFARQEVDVRREAEVTSTLLVAVQKQREAYDLRTLRRFEDYALRDILEMDDGSLWLMVQHTEAHNMRPVGSEFGPRVSHTVPISYEMEDLILF
ncbi:MAG: hypothetical protein D6722_00995, partial [Bacteroidetes bacterium]